MASDITQKVLIDLETRKAQREMQNLAKMSNSTEEAMLRMDHTAKELQRSIDAIKGPTSAFADFKSGMKAIGDLMGPFNQGLELAGKAIRFAKEGMDAYAKTSKSAAEEVRGVTTEFSRYRDTVMANVGELTVALAQSFPSIDHWEEVAKRMDQTGKSFKTASAEISKETKGAASIISAAFSSLANIDYEGIQKGLGDKIGEAAKKMAADAKKAAEEAKKLAEEMEKLGLKLLGSETPAQRAIRQGAADRAAFQAAVDADVDQMYRQEAFDRRNVLSDSALGNAVNLDFRIDMPNEAEIEELAQKLRDIQESQTYGGQTKSFFERAFGDVETLTLYGEALDQLKSTFDAFGDAVGASYEAIVTGQGSVSAAFKKMFADSLMAMGKESAVAALKETALGFGSLALGPLGGASAAMHFKAAALHAGVAVAAGAAAHSMGTSAQVAASEKAAEDKKKEEEKADKEREKKGRASGSGSGGGGGDSDRPIVVVIGNNFDDLSPRQRALEAERGYHRAKAMADE